MQDTRYVYPTSYLWPKQTQAPNGHGQSLHAGIPRVPGYFRQRFVIVYHTIGILEGMAAKGGVLIFGEQLGQSFRLFRPRNTATSQPTHA